MRNALIALVVAVLVAAGAIVWALTTITSNDQASVTEVIAENEALKDELEKLKGGEEESDEDDDEEEDSDEEDSDEDDDSDGEEEDSDDEDDDEDDREEYSGANYITIDSPENEQFVHELPISFEGVVSPNTKKIVVHAQGGEYVGMGVQEINDVYTLQDFDLGDTSFVYRAKPEWNNLIEGTNDYEFTAHFDDGTTKTANISIFYTPGGAEMAKPVIYLYPEQAMEVSVNVEPNGGFSVTDPAIGRNGWQVYAEPNGDLTVDGQSYDYLFWEGYAMDYKIPQEGFVIEANEVSRFFDEKLLYLGMKRNEIYDFKEFWVPLMQDDPYYFVTFVEQDDFDRYAPLSISPQPDSIIRVIFDHKGLQEPVEVVEQTLEPGLREGFTVVEWGGRLD